VTIILTTAIEQKRIVYQISIDHDGDACPRCGTPNQRVLWSKTVLFGRNEANRAGGSAFQWAAREQEEMATKLSKHHS
jgi:hypothetical protein